MQITTNAIGSLANGSAAPSSPSTGKIGLAADFASVIDAVESGAGNAAPADLDDFVFNSQLGGQLLGLPFRTDGVYSPQVRTTLSQIDEAYLSRLPKVNGEPYRPPVDNYDPRIELERLVRVEETVKAMEEAGEIDKAVDAFIGIHGLKDRLSASDRAMLKKRFIDLTKIALLENDWANAYLGKLKQRVDLSIDGIRTYLFSHDGKALTRPANERNPTGDPNLLGFIDKPQWQNFEVSQRDLEAKASEIFAKYQTAQARRR